MLQSNFNQIWEDEYDEEWEVQYHLEGNYEQWIEIDSIKSLSDGRDYTGSEQETILNYLNKNHETPEVEDFYSDYFGETA